MLQVQRFLEIFKSENARKTLRAVLVDGTGWLKLAGALILLTADIWLGVAVLQRRGMDMLTAFVIAAGLSALQIALFEKGIKILKKAQNSWQTVVAIATLAIGWIVVLGDSVLDGSAAFVKIGSGLPDTWTEFGAAFKDPFIFLCFILFFIFSLLGERLARLAIYGEYDEEQKTESLCQQNEESVYHLKKYPVKRLGPLKSGRELCEMNDGTRDAFDLNNPLLNLIS